MAESGRRANLGLQLGGHEYAALSVLAEEVGLSRHLMARLLICEAIRARGGVELAQVEQPLPATRGHPRAGAALAEWELDGEPLDRNGPVQSVRLGPQERRLLLELADELELPPARLARRLQAKGLLDLEEGRI